MALQIEICRYVHTILGGLFVWVFPIQISLVVQCLPLGLIGIMIICQEILNYSIPPAVSSATRKNGKIESILMRSFNVKKSFRA